MTFSTLTFGTPKFPRKEELRLIPFTGADWLQVVAFHPGGPQTIEYFNDGINVFESDTEDIYEWWADTSIGYLGGASISTDNPPSPSSSFVRVVEVESEGAIASLLTPRIISGVGHVEENENNAWVFAIEAGTKFQMSMDVRINSAMAALNEDIIIDLFIYNDGSDFFGDTFFHSNTPDVWETFTLQGTFADGTYALPWFQVYVSNTTDSGEQIDMGNFSVRIQ